MNAIPRRVCRRSTRGFVLYAVLGLIVLLLATAAFVFRDMRQRDVWANRYEKGEQALALAHAAVSNVLFAARNALAKVPVGGGATPDQGPLFLFLLQTPKKLAGEMAKLASSSGDHTAFVERMLGEHALEPIQRLLERHAGARLQLFVGFDAKPLFEDSGDKAEALRMFRDPIEKQIAFRVTATVTLGPAVRTAWTEKRIRVYSTLLPFSPRFTAHSLANGGAAAEVNDLETDRDGHPSVAGDAGPNRYFHRGELPGAAGSASPQGDAGWLFFGSSPAVFRLTAGSQHFHLSSTAEQPKAHRPQSQPPGVTAAHPADPDDPGVEQAFWVQAGFFGYHRGLDAQGLFGIPALDDRSSRLHLFGDATNPSQTRVLGPAVQRLAMFTDLAIDRDASGKDETDQRVACGRELPRREGRDPFLRRVTDAEYESDLEREKSCSPARNLIPFSSPGLSPHRVENLNALCDLDGDGIRETPVASEVGKEVLKLSPCDVTYRALFGAYHDYDPWACREVDLPYNTIASLMRETPEESFRRLAAEFLPYRAHTAFPADVVPVADIELPYRDPLHAAGEIATGDLLHFDVGRAPDADISEFAPEAVVDRRIVLQMSAREFAARYMSPKGSAITWLDMSERAIRVVDPLVLPAGTKVAGRGGGLLVAPAVKFEGNFEQPKGVSPLSIVAGSIDVADGATVDLAVFARGVAPAKGVTVRGSLGTGSLGELARWQGSVVSWDSRYDPTGPLAHERYRAEMSDRVLASGVAYSASVRTVTP